MKAIYKDPVMLREAAEARVHSMCFGYLDSGGDDEVFPSMRLRATTNIFPPINGYDEQMKTFPYLGDIAKKQGRLQ